MKGYRLHLWTPVVGAALLAALSFSAGTPVTRAASICVNPGGTGGCMSTIQAAVSAAKAGDTVTVAAGTYKEMVTVDKAITLQGAGASTTIIDATGLDHAIFVNGVKDPATITGFTAENANLAGILMRDSHALTLSNNTIQNNDSARGPSAPPGQGSCPGAPPFDGDDCGEGIHFQGVSDSVISNNLVQGNHGGMLVTDETGPTHDNLIVGNTVQNNTDDCGITLASHPAGLTPPQGPPSNGYGVYLNTIQDNMVMGNGTAGSGSGAGVGMFGPTPGTASYGNVVIGNTIMNNGQPGVTLHSHASGQNLGNNLIVNNIISGNGFDAGVTTSTSGIVIFADSTGAAAPVVGTLIAGNQISGQDVGVWVGDNTTGASIHNNDLTGNPVGVQNAGSGAVDADWNYWGCPGGPAASGCATMKGSVDADVWMPSAPPAPSSMP
jgi:parallel beta-helix repeat protein